MCIRSRNTWTSPDGITHNQIDHVLVDMRRQSSIIAVLSLRGADCDTEGLEISGVDDTSIKIRDSIKASAKEKVGVLETHRVKSGFDQECSELSENRQNYFDYKI